MKYIEVWTNDPPPGGFICSQCGTPVESEPCPDHGDDENLLARQFLRGVRRFRLERGLGGAS